MAIESLRTLTFSTESDVWSYGNRLSSILSRNAGILKLYLYGNIGVTLWEIYTFGNVPFPSESWDTNFVSRIESGMRMSKPKHCSPGT
jgi:hypothetical protein